MPASATKSVAPPIPGDKRNEHANAMVLSNHEVRAIRLGNAVAATTQLRPKVVTREPHPTVTQTRQEDVLPRGQSSGNQGIGPELARGRGVRQHGVRFEIRPEVRDPAAQHSAGSGTSDIRHPAAPASHVSPNCLFRAVHPVHRSNGTDRHRISDHDVVGNFPGRMHDTFSMRRATASRGPHNTGTLLAPPRPTSFHSKPIPPHIQSPPMCPARFISTTGSPTRRVPCHPRASCPFRRMDLLSSRSGLRLLFVQASSHAVDDIFYTFLFFLQFLTFTRKIQCRHHRRNCD